MKTCLAPQRSQLSRRLSAQCSTSAARARAAPLRVQAVLGSRPSLATDQPKRERVLFSLVAELANENALVQRFENMAGRGAMIGLVVATTFELLLPASEANPGLFGAWASSPQQFALLAALSVSAAALLASATFRKYRSQQLLEPVIASLTSKQRSAGSLAKKNVDKAVDYVLDSVFDQAMLQRYFLDD